MLQAGPRSGQSPGDHMIRAIPGLHVGKASVGRHGRAIWADSEVAVIQGARDQALLWRELGEQLCEAPQISLLLRTTMVRDQASQAILAPFP